MYQLVAIHFRVDNRSFSTYADCESFQTRNGSNSERYDWPLIER